ncbi:MAG: hypothetical protein K2F69_06420 [Bacteroidaceae bacterium]|nr:hypothetical protein [Bacteroidaceae bacterium]
MWNNEQLTRLIHCGELPLGIGYWYMEQSVETGNGFAFVARQKHFQIGNSDF